MSDEQGWQKTSLYIAPSANGMGWGVYAARAFKKGDIVEVAPLMLRFSVSDPVLKETLLDNYHYEYNCYNGIKGTHQQATVLSFGFSLYYNHAPQERRNIRYIKWGEEPTISNIGETGVAVGYYAVRDIDVGEELLCNYGGGDTWFRSRHLKVIDVEEFKKKQEEQEGEIDPQKRLETYASKIYSGYGVETFRKAIKNDPDHQQLKNQEATEGEIPQEYNPDKVDHYVDCLAPFDAGFQNAVAKKKVEPGETLEYVPVLVLSLALVRDTLLEPMVLFWKDLMTHAEMNDVSVGDDSTVEVLYKSEATDWEPQYMPVLLVKETALLPLAGSVGLLRREGDEAKSNCKIQVSVDPYNENGFTIRVVATKPIAAGEHVVLYMSDSSSKIVGEELREELVLTGQPLPPDA